MKQNSLIYVIYPIFVALIALIITKINYLSMIGISSPKVDKFYTDIFLIGLCAILFRIMTKKMW